MAELAEQGKSKAQYYVGVMYSSGEGVPQDHKSVVNPFLPAALR